MQITLHDVIGVWTQTWISERDSMVRSFEIVARTERGELLELTLFMPTKQEEMPVYGLTSVKTNAAKNAARNHRSGMPEKARD